LAPAGDMCKLRQVVGFTSCPNYVFQPEITFAAAHGLETYMTYSVRSHEPQITVVARSCLVLLATTLLAACDLTSASQPLAENTVGAPAATVGSPGQAAEIAATPTVTLNVNPTTVSPGATSTLIWSSTNATKCTASDGWTGNKAVSGTSGTAALVVTTKYTLTCTSTSGASVTKSTSVLVASSKAGEVVRPSYNTGDGFFVLKGKLYDPNGNEFRIRGVNRNHFDFTAQPAISNTGANAVRFFMFKESLGASTYTTVATNDHIAYKEVPIITMALFPNDEYTACVTDVGQLNAGVSWWVDNASTFAKLNKYAIINIVNEWGTSNSTEWRDAYISAVSRMRAAGYLGALMIDSGGCGQDMDDLVKYSGDVFNSDPQKNVIFSFHAYGGTTSANVGTLFAQLKALGTSTGAAYVIGEFGPGRDIGPSPTMVTPVEIIRTAEANGLGWLAWAWDDNNLEGGRADDSWFSMTYFPGTYGSPSDLTNFGKEVVLDSTYGLKALATPATIF
jgi:mannan endo-1,4-beta-mannosidase